MAEVNAVVVNTIRLELDISMVEAERFKGFVEYNQVASNVVNDKVMSDLCDKIWSALEKVGVP